MISEAGLSLISKGRVVRVAASSGRSLICESILDGRRNGEYHEGREKKGGERDSQGRLVVVHAGVKKGLDHSEGKFGVLGTSGSFLCLGFSRIEISILDIGTAEQSTMQKSQKQTPNERRQHEEGGNLRCLSFLADFMMGASFLGSSRQLGM